MTNKQTFFSVFIVAVLVSLLLLAVLIKVDNQIEQSRLALADLQKQIDKLHTENQNLKQSLAKVNNQTALIERDIDVTQELQRKQAQAIVDLRKGRKR